LRWAGGSSKVEASDGRKIGSNAALFSELGVSISDVFGADFVLWVDGQTEEICFPILAQHAFGSVPPDVAILSVRSVDEVMKTKSAAGLALDIYERVVTAGGLMPRNVRFSFDREGRTDEEVQRIIEKTKGAIVFLPRRCYENFLLIPSAITELIKREVGGDVTEEQVRAFVDASADAAVQLALPSPRWHNEEWLKRVNAPVILESICQHFGKFEYRKTRHSPMLTRWLLEHLPEALEELVAYVGKTCLAR
jgi:hypothetical protein